MNQMIKKFNEYLNDNFKMWFGDSKVIDDQGKPLVVYHSSDNKFSSFNKDKMVDGFHGKGIYFSTEDMEYGENIYKVYLRMEKPFDINGEYTVSEIENILGDKYSEIENIIQEESEISYNNKVGGFVFYTHTGNDLLQQAGYDGIMHHNIFVVFNPEQIKSAINNNGDFNPNSDNINETNN